MSFTDISPPLSPLLLQALADLGFVKPTLIQEKAIPLLLSGKDLLARARTGSGKTIAYVLPLLQRVLQGGSGGGVKGVILVPTRELSEQVYGVIRSLTKYCEKSVRVLNVSVATKKMDDAPDILIGTPSKVLALLQNTTLSLTTSLESISLDESDLLFSYGHSHSIKTLFNGSFFPKKYQSVMMSATMTEDVVELKGLSLRNPVILKLEEDEEEDESNLMQYSVRCNETDKFLLTYVILKLKLITGKVLIFVNSTDRCYRLKLFLEQFGIKSCVLNRELPLNSRVHAVQEFNKGVYDVIVATDEHEEEKEKEEFASTQRETAPAPPPSKKRKREEDYGVTRGIDFIDVSCVLNFDLPTSTHSYTHRIGRTARAGKSGLALSFILPTSEFGKNKVVGGVPGTEHDEQVWAEIEAEKGKKVQEYKFDMKQVEAFRYRMEDGLRSVTKVAVKEARVRELKSELLNSDRLKAHFEDNPLDLEYLRHDKPLHPTRVQPHMKHVPKYLLPRGSTASTVTESSTAGKGFVPFKKQARGRGRGGRGGGRGGRGRGDPLKKFGRS